MRLAATIGGLAAVAAIGWAGITGLEPCGWLDRMLGLSGCVASWEVSDLTAPRRTAAFLPGSPTTLVVAGATHVKSYDYGDVGPARVVLLDTASGEVTARHEVDPGGLVEQMAISPDGRRVALTCNRARGCDVAPMVVPDGIDRDDFVPVAMADLTAPRGTTGWWIRGYSRREVPVNADGTAAELRFSADGAVLVAGPHAWTVDAGADAPPPADTIAPAEGFDRIATPDGNVIVDRARGAVELAHVGHIPLDLPDGFVMEPHVPLALSPDGGSVALLARRFAGPGAVRAVLFAWRLADGVPLLRQEIADDLYAPLVWTPDGARLIVAVAAPPAMRARLEIRAYATGVSL